MDLENATIIDLETEGIGPRPNKYPPRIVGVGLLHPDGDSEYLAFGHDSNNNCDEDEARRAVEEAFRGPCIFHNAAFDLECIWKQWHAFMPSYWECTLIGSFLVHPHFKSLGLKKLAEQLFNEPPTEKNEMIEWILANVPGATKSTAMAYVGRVPGDLVGRYCVGDLTRTRDLARHLWPRIERSGMQQAYVREKRLMPYLLAAEARGIRINTPLLSEWDERLTRDMNRIDADIYREIGGCNLDSGDELADALEKAGHVPPGRWLRTPSDKRATSMPGLTYALKHHPELLAQLIYRAKCATLLRNHVLPWIEASAEDGRIHSQFNQVRGEDKGGTRTGRIGSSHINLANVPQPQIIELPPGYTELPVLRRAFLPNEGERWVSCDYSQIELRILAHLEDGELMRAYVKDPRIDMHLFVADLIRQRLGVNVTRKMAKTISFATIYGAGLDKLAEQLGCDKGTAMMLRDAYFRSLPGVADMQYDIRRRGRADEPVRTLGGRVYHPEKGADGHDYSYKLLNYTIQGGCADLLKEAIIQYGGNDMLCTVYDEINVSLPPDADPVRLRDVMCGAMKLDVPITADLEVGPNWADLEAFV